MIFLDLLSHSINQGSLAKYNCLVILSVRILWLFSNGIYNKLPQSSMPLDIDQYHLGQLCVRRILAGSSGCIVSRIHKDTGIGLPQGITLSIHRLQIQGCKIVSYHSILSPRSNFRCYLLLCLIIRLARDLETILNPVNGIEQPVL